MTSLIARLLYYSGLPSYANRFWAGRRRFVLMFHGVSARKHASIPLGVQPYLSSAELDSILGWIKKYFVFLSPREFFETRKPGILLTFDDGFSNNETNVLPILETYHAPAVFFITTQHVLEPRNWLPATRIAIRTYWRAESEVPEDLALDFFDGMNPGQLKRCADHPLITIGSHTLSHPFLTGQPVSPNWRAELTESKRLLESFTGQSVDYFAYPTGDYNQVVIDAIREAGYRAAFAVETKRLGDPQYEIPRIGLFDSDPIYLALKLSGFHRRPLPVDIFC